MTDFDKMADQFTMRLMRAGLWKHNYRGAVYSTRIKAAIRELKEAIAEAEQHPEIATMEVK